MEALLRADRFFGVSLLLFQQTQASFLAAIILASGVETTFEPFTHKWLRDPERVAAAQEARRSSAQASDARAAALGVFSSKTGRPDGMGMKISGGAQKKKQEPADLCISAADKVEADHSLAGFFRARTSDAQADALDVRSSKTGRPDCMGMKKAEPKK